MNNSILKEDPAGFSKIQWPKYALIFSQDNKFELGVILDAVAKENDKFRFMMTDDIKNLENKKKIKLLYSNEEFYSKMVKNNRQYLY